jgi:hypothetical protein
MVALSVLAAPLLASLAVWGCAESRPDPIDEDGLPSRPGADASGPSTRVPDGGRPSPKGGDDSGAGDSGKGTPSSDAGVSDAGKADGSAVDAGKQDAGAVDSGNVDSGGATDAGPGPLPSDAGSSTAPKPSQGEVLITEIMFDPSASEPNGEWIEVHNTASAPRTLKGLTLVDGANRTHVIGDDITLSPGAYAVLVRNKATALSAKVPASAIVYDYGAGVAVGSGIQLANGSTGGVWLRDGAASLAIGDYGGWFGSVNGASVQLKTLSFTAGGQPAAWCQSSNAWATGSDKGTPGASNDCP